MHRFLIPIACVALVAGPVAAGGAGAQPATETATVQVTMETRNGDVTCGPPRAAVAARSVLHLQVVNRSEQPLWFIAPRLFADATHLESAGFTLDVKQGGFSVAPEARATVVLRTPDPGAYPFSCHAAGATPNPRSSGFIDVVARAR